ncbi:hypothetical protein A9Q99_20740 [Gammaproteobacteria bacterium 45_16_T64]|mgnify:CR=1 FL=1|nr:hypothetical protein A9Q99_20740 [Gammaproteobacteria bacterium 45_16_T64]
MNYRTTFILKKSLLVLLSASGLLASLITCVNAADENQMTEPTRWYEINIAIFKQISPGFQNEQWRDREQLALSFPPRTLLLDDSSYSEVDFEDIILEPYTSDDSDTPLMGQLAPTPAPSPTQINHSTFGNDANILSFREIETGDEEFTQAIRRLNNSKAYKIITRKSWQQPGLPPKTSIPVLIQAGQEYEGNYELEGTVAISLSRYLHVKSNLWLSEYVKQVELNTAWWEQPALETPFEHTTNDTRVDEQGDNTLIIPTIQPAIDSANINVPINDLDSLTIQETTTRYEAVRTVVLNESRRMRSGELHYLDHPLFGMLVKIVPIEIAEIEMPAAETEEITVPQDSNRQPLPSNTLPPASL